MSHLPAIYRAAAMTLLNQWDQVQRGVRLNGHAAPGMCSALLNADGFNLTDSEAEAAIEALRVLYADCPTNPRRYARGDFYMGRRLDCHHEDVETGHAGIEAFTQSLGRRIYALLLAAAIHETGDQP